MRRLQPLRFPGGPGARTTVATTAELKRAGVKPWRLYAGDTVRPLRGVRAEQGVDPHDFESQVAAVRVLLHEGQFISRRTAARLLELPTMGRCQLLDVAAVRPGRAPRRPEIRGHQIRPGVLRSEVSGPLWLPHPADVWGLLASVSGLDELVMVGDHLISGRSRYSSALCVAAELQETVGRFSRSLGIRGLRQALPLLRTGVESPAESLLRLIIVRAGFSEPRTSCPVQVAGRVLFADLGYPELRIVIEYDGKYHFEGGVERARFDNERIESMIDAGWRVLRVTALDLRTPEAFLRRLAEAVARARSR